MLHHYPAAAGYMSWVVGKSERGDREATCQWRKAVLSKVTIYHDHTTNDKISLR